MDPEARAIVEPLTIEEFQRLSEDDAFRDELVRGRLVREPRPGGRHGWVTSELAFRIETFARERGLGRVVVETGFVLSEDPSTVRGPDVAFLTGESLPAEGAPVGPWRCAPDLAIEVLSPSDAAAGMQRKVLEYLAAGTRLVWIVDPETETVTVYRGHHDARLLAAGEELDGGDVLPGLRLQVDELFPA